MATIEQVPLNIKVPHASEFKPRLGIANPHAQTLWGGLVRRKDDLPAHEERKFIIEDGVQIVCHMHWQPKREEKLTVIVVHGLEGSSKSLHVIGVANKAWAAGLNVVRFNMRNCGGTEALTPTLYHSGLGGDILAVIRELTEKDGLQRVAVIGYSAGGNMTMNMLGEFNGRMPESLRACAVISPAMDPELTAYMLDEPHNYLYRRNFLESLGKLYKRKMDLYPHLYNVREHRRYESIVEFDEVISGPYNGYPGAKPLYDAISSSRFAEKVTVPVMVIRSLDDPFINYRPATVEKLHSNPFIHYVETKQGGHCAFIGKANGYDGRWAERACVEYVMSVDQVTR